ncbi:CbtB domain-containing protein [Prochlorothrix hollandica]|uniref:Cobalt transporter subunit (CbtB) n=1 Tax=Prochlorothrix hollandica PCC 9006 = CALU 1027 TaxID=317619 RepID=A0A0M2PVK8_PROHO|nr:CbtB-domain containing protein [Prochlorothrix hollandica]KKJ00200.1 cobalt transporter subunit (CbtB) [Prochlorothrix hollandica PCC 9006 = CALU 1027]
MALSPAASLRSTWQRTQTFTLSVPVQAALYTGLCSLTVWTLLFSTYPPAHDALHGTRHSTAAVACH